MILRTIKTAPDSMTRSARNLRLLVEGGQSAYAPIWFGLGGAVLGLVIVASLALRAGRD